MEQQLYNLLPDSIPSGQCAADTWHSDDLTQGNHKPPEKPISVFHSSEPPASAEPVEPSTPAAPQPKQPTKARSTKDASVSFLDMLASCVDEMFRIYPYETKRDIRCHLRDRLIDWVAANARSFFGPSTSRSISVCLRAANIEMDDLVRFAQFVSFLLDAPVKAGNKIVVWHGHDSTSESESESASASKPSRDPVCSLVIKKQGVFVENMKI